jgi:hypothetical protein
MLLCASLAWWDPGAQISELNKFGVHLLSSKSYGWGFTVWLRASQPRATGAESGVGNSWDGFPYSSQVTVPAVYTLYLRCPKPDGESPPV